jgi:hypothetical protein
MKIRRYCNLVANIAVSFAVSVIFSFAAAQTTDTESSSAAAGKTAEPVTDAPAKPVESNIVDAAAAKSPPVAAGETSDPAADAPAELLELNSVASPDAEKTAIGAGQSAEPAAGDSVEVGLLPEPVQPVRPRYNRDNVLWIQQRLEELGYYTGPVDGAFGRGTREAIKAYQADQELEQDGRPTAELRNFMWRNGG